MGGMTEAIMTKTEMGPREREGGACGEMAFRCLLQVLEMYY